MKVVSLNVGLPREVSWNGKTVPTGIFKEAVAGRLRLERLNFQGDRQADLSVHGGVAKAVYAYPSEHYPFWGETLGGAELAWGAFGENLTTEGLTEDAVCIGDRFRVGTAELVVSQPRVPCFKLGLRFNRPDMVKRFEHSGRSGFYLAVVAEGEVGAGDRIERVSSEPMSLSVAEVLQAYRGQDASLVARASQIAGLPVEWRRHLCDRLQKLRP
ncbi:MAG: MOSC domain-containing protein [Candidatus Binatia bacterium]